MLRFRAPTNREAWLSDIDILLHRAIRRERKFTYMVMGEALGEFLAEMASDLRKEFGRTPETPDGQAALRTEVARRARRSGQRGRRPLLLAVGRARNRAPAWGARGRNGDGCQRPFMRLGAPTAPSFRLPEPPGRRGGRRYAVASWRPGSHQARRR
jgi:hypothetical protein